jgi:DoxX-like family
MELTLQNPALIAAKTSPKAKTIVFWIVTVLFCLQMSFTAYTQLCLPQVAQAFTHLGFPAYFRVELSWANLLGVVLLLAPVPARLREWAYAGFAINLASALIAHLSLGDGPEACVGRRPPAYSGDSRASSGGDCRPRRRAPEKAG